VDDKVHLIIDPRFAGFQPLLRRNYYSDGQMSPRKILDGEADPDDYCTPEPPLRGAFTGIPKPF
jgi:hypothetical protein